MFSLTYAALRSSLLGRSEPFPRLEHARLQPLSDHPASREAADCLEQVSVVDPVERRRQVCVKRPYTPGLRAFACLVDSTNRILATAARPGPIPSDCKPCLPLRFPHPPYS